MKNLLLTISIALAGFCQAQVLDFNTVSAESSRIPGVFFSSFDEAIAFLLPGYEVPKGSGINTISSSGIWCAAKDSAGLVRLAAMKYGFGYDFRPGPISSTNDYIDQAYLNEYGTISNSNSSKWYVTKSEIQNHIWNGGQSGYVMPQSIATWPGNGISNVGVAQNLAPFVDMNNNGLYEPSLGDYPDIRGDAAYYTIMNDVNGIHSSSGGMPLGIEIHTMLYQYSSADYKDNTTYLNFRVFNRGNFNYSDFKFGVFTDFALGGGQDDFIGCDSLENMMYVYNSDNDDIGFGEDPPAFGITGLNKNMRRFCTYPEHNGQFIGTPADYYNFMSGLWPDGSSWTYGGDGYGGTQATNYLFSSNPNDGSGWSEVGEGFIGGNRRGVMIMEDEVLNSGDSECYDFAALFARTSGSNNLQNVNNLVSLSGTAKTDFATMNYNCDQVTLGLEHLDESQIGLFPNPSSGEFTLSFGDQAIDGQIIITDISGRIVLSDEFSNENVKILTLDNKSGVYNVIIKTDSKTIHKKLIIKE